MEPQLRASVTFPCTAHALEVPLASSTLQDRYMSVYFMARRQYEPLHVQDQQCKGEVQPASADDQLLCTVPMLQRPADGFFVHPATALRIATANSYFEGLHADSGQLSSASSLHHQLKGTQLQIAPCAARHSIRVLLAELVGALQLNWGVSLT